MSKPYYDKQGLRDWWEELQGISKENANHRGERAELRRCDNIDQIFAGAGPMFVRLCRRLPYWSQRYPEALAVLAALLARVEKCSGHSFAAQLGTPKDGLARPVMSEFRFQKMQKVTNWDELFINLRRAVDLLGNEVNVISLADTIFLWAQKLNGEIDIPEVRRLPFELAKDYYSKTLELEK
ncbi:type I-E CRISPR-associated protein Cse2/CasB [Methylocaldum sp. GT1BB]|uniref:type I-E CRISPR-associated protein Cse2/CasB n=1 Tax=Methylocaldum sp. GT1BB TaxID=3438963 RepID=UPI003DA06786